MEAEIARLDERSKDYRAHVFAEIMKARRMAEILKVPTLVEMIEDLYEEGISPVVFVNFEDTMAALQKRLASYGDVVGVIKGGQSAKERQLHIDEFQANTRRIMLVNLAAAMLVSVFMIWMASFLDTALCVLRLVPLTWFKRWVEFIVAEGKVLVCRRLCLLCGTIEERCCQRVQSKLRQSGYVE
jgi:hypothetical protein